MAGSRLEKFGTVFTRVRDLMRAGVLKEKDKPIWYDVYAAFPPKREPLYVKPRTKVYGKQAADTVPDIFYKEDAIRAFIEKYQELEAQGLQDEDALFEETGRALLSEGLILRRRGGATISAE
ncbi:28S ribosomal protein S23, mitochondrial isoform X2 [Anguilla rostrata]|uniref:28S ribosomal protein S23, mitochondrial isoform X2 n=1 Tax=Anguilla rostrata TaxID=7938 RepID=UPI0030D016E7